jgi:DNA-binding GntR family transcriptional regulator
VRDDQAPDHHLRPKAREYINEAYISNMLGIGRTPVHQAFDRLMLEGMVGVIPRKGVIVKPVSLDEIMQIVEVRLLNEPTVSSLRQNVRSGMRLRGGLMCCRALQIL